tara:strand:+ start:555 stop:842 length:288 start_codon:yes stop_codon:yes gene_type:complete
MEAERTSFSANGKTTTIQVGDIIKLSGVTHHGKNRVRENGNLAEIFKIDGLTSDMLCVKFLIRHVDNLEMWRWIDFPEDEHMNWEQVETEEGEIK